MSGSMDRSLRVVANDPIREAAARDYFGRDYVPLGEGCEQPTLGAVIAFRGGWVAAMAEAQRRSVEDLAALDYAEAVASEAWDVLRRIRDGEADPQRIAGDLLEAHGFVVRFLCDDCAADGHCQMCDCCCEPGTPT